MPLSPAPKQATRVGTALNKQPIPAHTSCDQKAMKRHIYCACLVLTEDIFKIDAAAEIEKVKVEMTVMGGKVVYQKKQR